MQPLLNAPTLYYLSSSSPPSFLLSLVSIFLFLLYFYFIYLFLFTFFFTTSSHFIERVTTTDLTRTVAFSKSTTLLRFVQFSLIFFSLFFSFTFSVTILLYSSSTFTSSSYSPSLTSIHLYFHPSFDFLLFRLEPPLFLAVPTHLSLHKGKKKKICMNSGQIPSTVP